MIIRLAQRLGVLCLGAALMSGCVMPRLAPTTTEPAPNVGLNQKPNAPRNMPQPEHPTAATSTSAESPDEAQQILNLLRFVPLTLENRRLLSYGNQAAWFDSWNVQRPANVDELDQLTDADQQLWFSIFARQTLPPRALGRDFINQEDQQDLYGFDLFNVQRSLDAGIVPEAIAVAQLNVDMATVRESLLALGYEEEEIAEKVTLFSIRDDYEISFESETITNRLGDRNRIIIIDDLVMMTKATEVASTLLEAHSGRKPSLADDPSFVAAIEALTDEAMKPFGQLLGLTFFGDLVQPDIASIMFNQALSTDEMKEAIEERMMQEAELPAYLLNAFATLHQPGAPREPGTTYLVVATVFPPSDDVESATETLANRMTNYVSIATGEPMTNRWAFEDAFSLEANGLPVSLVVMRVDDPVRQPDGTFEAYPNVLAWIDMIIRADIDFLVP